MAAPLTASASTTAAAAIPWDKVAQFAGPMAQYMATANQAPAISSQSVQVSVWLSSPTLPDCGKPSLRARG